MGFKTKELIFIAIMAALLFVVNLLAGSGIIAATGVPGSSGFITGLTNLIIATFVALSLKKFGSVTLMYFIYGLLALPTHMAGGPPGFVWKVPLIVLAAFSLEFPLWIGRYKKISFILALPIFIVVGAGIYILAFWLLGVPEFDKIIKVWPIMVTVFIIEGYIGVWLGHLLHGRLKNKRVLKQITS